MKRIYIYVLTMLIACTFGLVSCTDTDDVVAAQYGYVQFKVYKKASAGKQIVAETRAVNELEYLSEACKIKVIKCLTNYQEGNNSV